MSRLRLEPASFLSPSDALKRSEIAGPSKTLALPQNNYHLEISHRPQLSDVRVNQSVIFRKVSATRPPCSEACDVPRLTRTPWELERHKKKSVWKRTSTESRPLHHFFRYLPREVYDCILDQLEILHFSQGQSCASCYLNDLRSLSLTSRVWDRAATLHMYRSVRIPGKDGVLGMRRNELTGASRLKLLRRTLRDRHSLARLVRELDLSELQTVYYNASIERESIVNLVASVVMACPNLERLVGFHIPYTHEFDRLSHALSTRRKLKEKVWTFADTEYDTEEDEDDLTRDYYHASCDPMERFLELNSNYAELTTLVLHQDSLRPLVDLTFRAIVGTLQRLPALTHLALSGLSRSSFSNTALNAIPSNLQALRLQSLPGVNDAGLKRFASSPAAASLKNLSLINLNIGQLITIGGFLSPHLAKLERFTFIQHKSPILRSAADIPSFQSPKLWYIHWEIQSQGCFPQDTDDSDPFISSDKEIVPCLATKLLATSVHRGLFPALQKMRVPHDPQGILQALCKPLAAMSLRPKRPYRMMQDDFDSGSSYSLKEILDAGPPETRADSAFGSPASTSDASQEDVALYSRRKSSNVVATPAESQLAAYRRILAARRKPRMRIRVTDPEGELCWRETIGNFLGDVASNITYDLRPDRIRTTGGGGWEERDGEDGAHDWITSIDDVLGEWEVVDGGWRGRCRHSTDGRAWTGAVDVGDMF